MIANIDTQWVETTVRDMRRSAYYREHIMDEWYETLPVPIIRGRSVWVVISFGKTTAREAGYLRSPVRPHLSYSVEYSSLMASWEAVPATAFNPVDMTPTNEKPVSATTDIMGLRRSYYQSLSLVLASHALVRQINTKATDCNAVIAMRDALFAAANPSMLWYYKQSIGLVQNWLETHCQPLMK